MWASDDDDGEDAGCLDFIKYGFGVTLVVIVLVIAAAIIL
jgi:hypothetical protein